MLFDAKYRAYRQDPENNPKPMVFSSGSNPTQSELADKLTEIEGISGLDQDAKDSIKRQVAEQYYQKGPDLDTFQTMLNKLTGSKMKQQGQVASARRGDIYAGGLANMMSNF